VIGRDYFHFDSRTRQPTRSRCELLSAPAVDWESIEEGDPDRGELIVADLRVTIGPRGVQSTQTVPNPILVDTRLAMPSQYERCEFNSKAGRLIAKFDLVRRRAGRTRVAPQRPFADRGRLFCFPDDSWEWGMRTLRHAAGNRYGPPIARSAADGTGAESGSGEREPFDCELILQGVSVSVAASTPISLNK